jgi:hypothetical protein
LFFWRRRADAQRCPPFPRRNAAARAQVTVYAAHADGAIEPLQVHVDEDVRASRQRPALIAPATAIALSPSMHAARAACVAADAPRRRRAAAQPEEYFFCCTWAFNDANGAALLLFAGHKGVIRILDATAQALYKARCRTRAPTPRAPRASSCARLPRARAAPAAAGALPDARIARARARTRPAQS